MNISLNIQNMYKIVRNSLYMLMHVLQQVLTLLAFLIDVMIEN